MRNVSISYCGPFQAKLWKVQSPLLCSENAIIFFSLVEDTLQTGFPFFILFTLTVNVPEKKNKHNPRLNTDTVLGRLQPTPEMGLASGFETYLTAHCSYQKKGK